MKHLKRLLTLLPDTSWDDPQLEEKKLYHRILLYLIEGASAVLLLIALLDSLQEQWVQASALALAGVVLLVVLVVLGKRFPLSRRLAQEALHLRAAAEGADDRLAPSAAVQPAPLPAEDRPAGTITLGPLWRRKQATKVGIIVEVIIGALCMLLPLGVFLQVFVGMPPTNWDAARIWVTLITGLMLTLPLAYGGVQMLRIARRTALSAYILIDEQGLHWRHPLSEKKSLLCSLDWQQACSFFVIAAAEPDTTTWMKSYVLDARACPFSWQVSHRSTEQERAASDRLCRLIVTQTHLPLRDLSAAAAQALQHLESGQQAEQPANSAQQAG